MEQNINERFIKLSSKVPIPQDLQLGEDIVVTLLGQAYIFNVVKQEINDLQDGSVNITYVCKNTIE